MALSNFTAHSIGLNAQVRESLIQSISLLDSLEFLFLFFG